jgi:CheY-like chemotaxis protein
LDEDAPALDAVARRIEELSLAVAEQTQRLLEKTDPAQRAPGEDLATILEAARRSSELARELVILARRERDVAAAALVRAAGVGATSERPLESVPAVSHRRVRNEEQSIVLLVEDEPLLLKTMRRMLEQYGYRVLPTAGPSEALSIALQEAVIDLVVTDLVLPEMSGSELVKRLRSSRPGLRVLYTSGWDPASSGVTLSPDGTEAFLAKPFSPSELESSLADLLAKRPLRRAERW